MVFDMDWIAFIALLVGALVFLSVVMFAAWRLEQQTGNAGWVDTFWSLGTGSAAAIGSLVGFMQTGNARGLLVALLVAAWAIRLGLHVGLRSASVKDDPRYAKLRTEWGPSASAQMFKFLQIQALFGALLAMSVIVAAWNPAPLFQVQDFIALGLIVIAIGGEGLADWQLRQFRADPSNRGYVCEVGLWRYSRHPNYFFECLVWLAWPVFALDFHGQYLWGWFAVLAPACMYWLLTQVSGIPPLEAIMVEKYGERYRSYQSRTSAFFPLPPAPGKERRA
jgi:steroid 5-alpha reductase family enzyme